MHIKLNGEEQEISATTLQQLVVDLGLEVRMIAIEHNREVAPRGRWSSTTIVDGDQIEIVHMIGGG
ncbi:MAG: sulfur carrier protein ThiS [Mariprofundales bacterium]|nr:sulfur carrier protein ThiS [Mariprofundales bacterium]